MRTPDEQLEDVRRVIEGARAIVACGEGASSPYGEELRAAIAKGSGLSRPGVDLALAHHLELDPKDDDLVSLVRGAGDADWVHVVLAANVFVAALRAIAIARAAAPRVTVRPSSRDPAFARALVAATFDPAIELVDDAGLPPMTRGEVHVYGRDATIMAVRVAAPAGVVVRGHGAGLGVGCALGDDARGRAIGPAEGAALLRRDAEALASDVVPFDQRGCLSPRIAFVVGDRARALRFAEHVHHALTAAERAVPRGELAPDELAGAARYDATVAFAGDILRGAAHIVGVADSLTIPPPGRHVHVVPVATIDDVATVLAPIARAVVAFGVSPGVAPWRFRDAVPRYARISALGAMQRPPLDGPVDLRPTVPVSKDR